jgi:hypothetical protein
MAEPKAETKAETPSAEHPAPATRPAPRLRRLLVRLKHVRPRHISRNQAAGKGPPIHLRAVTCKSQRPIARLPVVSSSRSRTRESPRALRPDLMKIPFAFWSVHLMRPTSGK